ncbi:hypothetical protein DNTS_004049 [Danionella cerebrum]|uniref:Large ribosomal subunit protein bL32m n=1 Tax=Danionella cerebrum TaxID=2873325 RepID=A0A553RE31_9TELE|nr:hypothetical protein DNTS_004049 [Danionella translucida]
MHRNYAYSRRRSEVFRIFDREDDCFVHVELKQNKIPCIMSLSALVRFFGRSLQRLELRLWQAAGFEGLGPALAVNGPGVLPHPHRSSNDEDSQTSFLDSIFWMAAPKKRRTIEVNRCRRRNPNKLIKVKHNIEPCPECGNLKQKHVLCGFCHTKVRIETGKIRRQISEMEGGPFNAPAVETVVVYENESIPEADVGKRVVECKRKRPNWFSL